MQFLNSICTLCSTAGKKGLTESLDVFCFLNDVPQNIEVRRHGTRVPALLTRTGHGQREAGKLCTDTSVPLIGLQVLLRPQQWRWTAASVCQCWSRGTGATQALAGFAGAGCRWLPGAIPVVLCRFYCVRSPGSS